MNFIQKFWNKCFPAYRNITRNEFVLFDELLNKWRATVFNMENIRSKVEFSFHANDFRIATSWGPASEGWPLGATLLDFFVVINEEVLRYDPNDPFLMNILTHELCHVRQYKGIGKWLKPVMRLWYEREATRLGNLVEMSIRLKEKQNG